MPLLIVPVPPFDIIFVVGIFTVTELAASAPPAIKNETNIIFFIFIVFIKFIWPRRYVSVYRPRYCAFVRRLNYSTWLADLVILLFAADSLLSKQQT